MGHFEVLTQHTLCSLAGLLHCLCCQHCTFPKHYILSVLDYKKEIKLEPIKHVYSLQQIFLPCSFVHRKCCKLQHCCWLLCNHSADYELVPFGSCCSHGYDSCWWEGNRGEKMGKKCAGQEDLRTINVLQQSGAGCKINYPNPGLWQLYFYLLPPAKVLSKKIYVKKLDLPVGTWSQYIRRNYVA